MLDAVFINDRLAQALEIANAGIMRVAIEIWRSLLDENPNILEAQQNLALALFKQQEYVAARSHLERACRLFPEDPMLVLWHGHVLQKLCNTEEAAAAYASVVKLSPDTSSAWLLLAMARRDLADYHGACTAIEQYLRLKPFDPQGHFEYAQILLGLGKCSRGFTEYEWRFQRVTCPARQYHHPRWDGTLKAGLRLLVYAEQGYGDTIQFARFIPYLAREGMDVTLACYPELARLMHFLSGNHRVVELGSEPCEIDANIPIMSLGHFCGGAINSDIPYLSVNTPLRPLLPTSLPGKRKRIGLVWAGSNRHNNDDVRSIEWVIFSGILQNRRHTFYSLQVGGQRPEPWPEELIDLAPLINDYADTAAFLSQLDLVITVDTSVAHLAGAIGLPLWLLLPYAPDWRWLIQETIGPWYRDIRMFRQARRGDWRGVIAEVVAALSVLEETVSSLSVT